MIRRAAQITVPIVCSAELDTSNLTSEYEDTMNDLNKHLGDGWRIFSTHTVNNKYTTYLVYVLVKIEFEKREDKEC